MTTLGSFWPSVHAAATDGSKHCHKVIKHFVDILDVEGLQGEISIVLDISEVISRDLADVKLPKNLYTCVFNVTISNMYVHFVV